MSSSTSNQHPPPPLHGGYQHGSNSGSMNYPHRPRPHRLAAQRQNSKAVKAERTHGPHGFERRGLVSAAGGGGMGVTHSASFGGSSGGAGGGGGGEYHPGGGGQGYRAQYHGQQHDPHQQQQQHLPYPGMPHGNAAAAAGAAAAAAAVRNDFGGAGPGGGESVYSRIGRWFVSSSSSGPQHINSGGRSARARYNNYPPPQQYHPHGNKSSSWWWCSNTAMAAGCACLILIVLLGGNGNAPQQQRLQQRPAVPNIGGISGGNIVGADTGSLVNAETAVSSLISAEEMMQLRKAAVPPPPLDGGDASRDRIVRIFHAVDFDDDHGEAGGDDDSLDNLPVRRLAAMLESSQGRGNEDDDDSNNGDNNDNGTDDRFEYRTYGPTSRRSFLANYGHLCYDDSSSGGRPASTTTSGGGGNNAALLRYDDLAAHPSLQLELWKSCMLYLGHGTAYVDATDVALVQTFQDSFFGKGRSTRSGKFAIQIDPGTAAEGDGSSKDAPGSPPPLMVHPSLLILPDPLSSVPLGIVRLLVETPNKILESSPLLVPRESRRLIDADGDDNMKKDIDDEDQDNEDSVSSSGWTILLSRCVKLADPSVTVRSLWAGVKLSPSTTDAGDGPEPIEGSIAQQLGPGTDAAISGERYGTSRLYPHRHGGLHVQSDSESSLVHTSVTPDANSRRVSRHCVHPSGGMCCEVFHPGEMETAEEGPLPLLLVRHPVSGRAVEREVPTSGKALDSMKGGASKPPPLPYLTDLGQVSTVNNVTYSVAPNEAPYMTTVREVILSGPSLLSDNGFTPIPTPNFFDILLENDCLPTSKACHSCLKRVRDGKGHDCKSCAKECGCYCKVLCKIRPPEKNVVKEYRIYPPAIRRDGDRLVPRIVHQTWFEPVTREKYPNMSRLIESWKRSGWEYNFYDDDTAASFLSTHFPPEVRQAYDAVLPGAFKADLFRYCVLLIRGGVYADMDVLLESNLDAVVSGDVGFMVPMDSPGTKIGRRSCLWNGLMAVAPGHPFLAKTIELVVNNIRNRFTSVDYDDMLCPNPVFQISHSVDTLFTCGPCILGGAINAVLGKHMQEPYEPGDIDIWGTERMEQSGAAGDGDVAALAGMEKKQGIVVSPEDQRLLIPGRTIILQQNKADMGAHRFTWTEKNIMVAATDMPDYDDRPPTLVHYSKTHGKAGVYGVKKLYADNAKADEKIRLVVQPI